MKKKLIFVSAAVLLIALTTVALVSCTNSPFDIIKGIDKASSYTISVSDGLGGSTVSIYNKGNISVMSYTPTEKVDEDGKIVTGMKLVNGVYYIKNGANYNKYSTEDGENWTKTEAQTADVDKLIAELKEMTLKATEHIQKDRVVVDGDYWYVKDADGKIIEEFAYEVINGTLYKLVKDPEDKEKLTEVFYYKQSGEVNVPSSVKKAVGEIK